MKTLLLKMMILFLCTNAFGEGTVCYSTKTAFIVQAPKGWVRDVAAAKNHNLCVLYVLEGKSFDTSPAIMYPRLVQLSAKNGKTQTLKEFMDNDVSLFLKNSPKIEVNEVSLTNSIPNLKVASKDFLGGPPPNEFQRVTYVNKGDDVFILVLSTRKKSDLEIFKNGSNETIGKIQIASRPDAEKMLTK